jgi:hypothetical protein
MDRTFDRGEIEDAFRHWWQVGNIAEDWLGWSRLFTADAEYVEHYWGTFHGAAEIGVFCNAVMKSMPEVYSVLEWYVVGDDKVCFYVQNRRDNPDPDGVPYFDVPQISTIWYAGDGLWRREEAFWSVTAARATKDQFRAAVEKTGVKPLDMLTRKHWPTTPEWARTDHPPRPSWLDRPDVPTVSSPRDLRPYIEAVSATR